MLNKKILVLITLISILSACKSVDVLNPFQKGPREQSSLPEGTVSYTCEDNKQFYVRMLNGGKDAWLIYPDHEVNLNKTSDSNRYTSGAIALEINGDQTTLTDGDTIAYKGCKTAAKKA